jgi:hypothetical protein
MTPTAWARRPESFHMSRDEWGKALRLSAEGGYRPNDMGGFRKTEVRQLATALRTGLEQGKVADVVFRDRVASLLKFLTETPAANGFQMNYQWKHLNRAG